MEWSKRVPSVGGRYWVRGCFPADVVFQMAVPPEIREVRIVNYGPGPSVCEVLMSETLFRGGGWRNFGEAGVDECQGPHKLEFAGPIPEPKEPS